MPMMKDGSFEHNFDQETGPDFGQKLSDSGLQGMDFDDTEDFEVAKIPVPSELPKAFDFRSLPGEVTKSSAVEALIQQNDDLMSRLSVALRRISDLEEDLLSERQDGLQYRGKYENLRDQVLVLKEKIRLLTERKENEEAETQGFKEQIQLLEIRYAELYQASQRKEARLSEQLSLSQKNLGRLQRFQRRFRQAAQSLKATAKNLSTENARLERRLEGNETLIADIRRNLTDSTDYIRTQKNTHESEILRLTETFEAKLHTKEETLQKLMAEVQILESRRDEFERTLEKNVELENALVLKERQFEDYRLQSSTDLTDAQKTLARYRNESKELALQLETAQREKLEKSAEAAGLKEENFRLTEQVENLQVLWKDQNLQIEKLDGRHSALQKLNQELSMAVNQYRKEIRELRERLDAQNLEL
jgi:chromosome segregation ATPase